MIQLKDEEEEGGMEGQRSEKREKDSRGKPMMM